MRAIIVDDEKNSRDLLRSAIENFTTGVEIIGETNTVLSSVKLITLLKPDLLFLDIELPDGKGFDILDKLEDEYRVVFVTAYDDYAIKAIRYSAFDYLLKPLDLDDLETTIERLKSRPPVSKSNIGFLNEQLNSTSHQENKIIVPSNSGYTLLEIDKIVALEANTNYVFFILDNGKKHIATHSLNYYEDLLPEEKFYRIHKSHIVNFTKVKSIELGRTGKAILENGLTLDIAARRKTAFMSYFKRYMGK